MLFLEESNSQSAESCCLTKSFHLMKKEPVSFVQPIAFAQQCSDRHCRWDLASSAFLDKVWCLLTAQHCWSHQRHHTPQPFAASCSFYIWLCDITKHTDIFSSWVVRVHSQPKMFLKPTVVCSLSGACTHSSSTMVTNMYPIQNDHECGLQKNHVPVECELLWKYCRYCLKLDRFICMPERSAVEEWNTTPAYTA